MLSVNNLRVIVIQPALAPFPEAMKTPAAEALLLGTALVESGLMYLRQGLQRLDDGRGAALGLWQMEARTHEDHWRYLQRHPAIAAAIEIGPKPPPERLCTDLLYACRMARVHYWRVRAKMPEADDLQGLADYWKPFYNTELGAGDPAAFVRLYTKHVKP